MRSLPVRRLAPLAVAALLVAVVAPQLVGDRHTTEVSAATYPSNGQGDLVFVGDSLTEGAEYFGSLRAGLLRTLVWPRVTVDYKRGRTVRQGIPVLRKRLGTAPQPTAVMIALGTNDMMSHAEASYPATVINEMMQAAGGLPVMWVNVTFDAKLHPDWRARAARFNRALTAASTRWPNLTVVNWYRYFVPNSRVRFIADGVHLTVTAYRTRATWIAARAAEFGRTVVNASTTTTTSSSTTTSTSTTTTLPVSTTTSTVAVTTTT